MSSVASFVYTRLGIQALEEWTNLKRELSQLQVRLDKATNEEVDNLLKEVHSVGMQIQKIEDKAGVPKVV